MDNNFTISQKEEIVNSYKNGVRVDQIINRYKTNEHNVREVLKEYQADRKYNNWSNELYQRGFDLYSKGFTLKDIAYKLCVSQGGFSNAMNKMNIPKRSTSECNKHIKRNSNYFDNIDTENKAYILGLLYADGNNFTKHNAITLSLQESDFDLLEQIRLELEYDNELHFDQISRKNPNYKNQYRLVINDEHMSKRLAELGVVDHKSLIIRFPRYLRPDLLRHFVRGYFDGDGCISYDAKRNKFNSGLVGTFDFTTSVSNILSSMFIKNSIYHPKQSGESNTFVVQTVGNKSSYSFLSWMYRDSKIKMERKYDKYLNLCKIYTNPKGGIKSL